ASRAVGVVALAYGRRWSAAAVESRAARRRAGVSGASAAAAGTGAGATEAEVSAPDRGAWLTLWALGLSGTVSMVYEVAWTRALAQVIGSSTYAFTAMLVAFLLGIAGGAALYARLRGDRPASPTDFALIQGGIGLAAGALLGDLRRRAEVRLWGV